MSYKVLHICSSTDGGAGIAALRLHRALRQSDIDSKFLCLNTRVNDTNVFTHPISIYSRIIRHLPIKFRQNKYNRYEGILSNKYESISFPESIFDISKNPLVEEADIINLHWIGNMMNYPKFFKRIKKPIVWTLHDMNPFLGFAHYLGDINRNPQYLELENKIKQIKLKSYTNSSSISIVNLCKWMYEYSSESDAFKDRNHHIIPNCIDTEVFKLRNKNVVRLLLEIPDDKPVIMFCCQSLSNPRKGWDIMLNALELISSDLTVITVGNNTGVTVRSYHNIKSFGNISDENFLSLIYSAADAFILPSREDNLPNTMLESLCCGTPVISFKNGGMRDIINTHNGILVPEQKPQALASAIDAFIETRNQYSPLEISQNARNLFNPQNQALKYDKLYRSLLI